MKQHPPDEFGFRGAAVSSAISALQHLEIGDRADYFLIGSCAEGFSDPMSDIDVLIVIPPGDSNEPEFRQYTWVGDQRIEIYSRTTDTLRAFVERMNALTSEMVVEIVRQGRMSEDALEEDLELYHRVLFAYPIEQNGVLSEVHASMDRQKLMQLRSTLETLKFQDFLELALAAEELRSPNLATSYARSALEAAASSWSARRGQTYAAKKFLSWRLSRGGLSPELIDAFEGLMTGKTPELLHRSAQFKRFVDMFEMPAGALPAKFSMNEGVLQVRLKNQLWIGDQHRTVVVPSASIGAFAAAIGSGAAQIPASQDVRRVCFLAGLSYLETSSGRKEAVSQAVDGRRETILTANGFWKLPSGPIAVDEGVPSLVTAGMAIFKAGFSFAHCKEDAIGAAKTARWRQFEIALGRMRQYALDAISYSETFRPAPLESGLVETFRPSTVAGLLEQAQKAASIRCRDAASAKHALDEAEAIISRLVPDIFGQLSKSMSDARAGVAFFELGIVWGKIAKGIGRKLQREWEAILDKFGTPSLEQEMRVFVKPEMFQFDWARSDDLRIAVTEVLDCASPPLPPTA